MCSRLSHRAIYSLDFLIYLHAFFSQPVDLSFLVKWKICENVNNVFFYYPTVAEQRVFVILPTSSGRVF